MCRSFLYAIARIWSVDGRVILSYFCGLVGSRTTLADRDVMGASGTSMLASTSRALLCEDELEEGFELVGFLNECEVSYLRKTSSSVALVMLIESIPSSSRLSSSSFRRAAYASM